MGILRGEDVVLEKPDGTTVDVENVLLHPTDLSDQTIQDVQTRFINQARYKGDQLTLTAYWPKTADHELMDCHIWARGERYKVYGTPFGYSPQMCPTDYDVMVTITRTLYLFDVDLGLQASYKDEWGAFHEHFDWVSKKGNLLRLAEDGERGTGTQGPSGILMFEFKREDWPAEEVAALRYPSGEGGHLYRISATAYSEEAMIVTAAGGVADG